MDTSEEKKQAQIIPQKKKNQRGKASRLVVYAAFFISVVSWYTTMQGLKDFVFTGSASGGWLENAQAGLISFGIQTILFVINLNIFRYMKRIWCKIPKHDVQKSFFGYLKATGIFFARLILCCVFACMCFVILISSSWFSFVHFSEETHANTRYSESQDVLESKYYEYLDLTDKYLNEAFEDARSSINTAANAMPELVSAENAQEYSLEKANTAIQGITLSSQPGPEFNEESATMSPSPKTQGKIDAWHTPVSEYIETCGKSISEISEYSLLRQKIGEYESIIEQLSEKYQLYCTEYNGYYYVTQKELELKDQIDDLSDKAAGDSFTAVETAKSNLIEKLQEMTQLTKASVTKNILSKTLEADGEHKDINDDLSNMSKTILNSGLTGDNFKNCVDGLQKVSAAAYVYSKIDTLRSDESGTKKLRNEMLNSPIDLPSDSQPEKTWRSEWQKRYLELQQILRSIPDKTSPDDNPTDSEAPFESKDTAAETVPDKTSPCNNPSDSEVPFEPKEAAAEIDDLLHMYTAELNAMERAGKWLFVKQDFLSWFSLALAFFIDLTAVFAGVFARLAKEKPKDSDKPENAA